MGDLFDSAIVEVLIILTFVYVLFSTVVSGINEGLAAWTRRRSADLVAGMRQLLGDDDTADVLMARIEAHPLVRSLGRTSNGTWRPPSYLPGRRFAQALVDVIDEAADGSLTVVPTGGGAPIPLDTALGEQLRRFARAAANDFAGIVDDVAGWFDDVMDRVAGWYKRTTWIWLAVIAVAVAGVLNLDTISIAQTAWEDDAVRTALVTEAEELAAAEDLDGAEIGVTGDDIDEFAFPLWWTPDDGAPNEIPENVGGWVSKIVGILVTAAALTLGAPFWFDLLGRLTGLRGAGNKPKTAAETDGS